MISSSLFGFELPKHQIQQLKCNNAHICELYWTVNIVYFCSCTHSCCLILSYTFFGVFALRVHISKIHAENPLHSYRWRTYHSWLCIGRRKPVFLSPFKLQHAERVNEQANERVNKRVCYLACLFSMFFALLRNSRFNISSISEWKQIQTRVRACFHAHTHSTHTVLKWSWIEHKIQFISQLFQAKQNTLQNLSDALQLCNLKLIDENQEMI